MGTTNKYSLGNFANSKSMSNIKSIWIANVHSVYSCLDVFTHSSLGNLRVYLDLSRLWLQFLFLTHWLMYEVLISVYQRACHLWTLSLWLLLCGHAVIFLMQHTGPSQPWNEMKCLKVLCKREQAPTSLSVYQDFRPSKVNDNFGASFWCGLSQASIW